VAGDDRRRWYWSGHRSAPDRPCSGSVGALVADRRDRPGYLVTPALRAPHTLGPAETSDRVKALGVVEQELEVDQGIHRGRLLPADNGEHPRSQDQSLGTSVISPDRRQDPRTNLPTTTLKPDMRLPARGRAPPGHENMVKPLVMVGAATDLSDGDRREVGFWQVNQPAYEIDRHRIQASPRVATRFGRARASVFDLRCGDRHGVSSWRR
jgi:hypothetical protein